jgi:DNA modification methylase
MNGERADVGFTSPPYALGKSAALSGNKANKARGNAYEEHNDNSEDWARLMTGWYNQFEECAEAWCVNVQPLAGNKRALFNWIAENSSRLVDVAIWAKDNSAPQMAKNVLTSQYELLVFLGKEGASRAIPFANFQGNQSALYKGGANRENVAPELHGAAMPIHLPKWVLVELFSQAKSVIEPFAGTGTTFIVCEELNRKCYGMELDPKYCDVIVKRWEDFTGKKAELWKP